MVYIYKKGVYMAEKRYYWLKLKEDYFNSPKIKKLRKIAGGDTYTIIYLKMQLLSIKNKGIIEFEKIEPTFEEELALKLDEDIENVSITLHYLQSQGLVDVNNDEFLLIDASNNIGSESDSAERVRLFRKKQELLSGSTQTALQCNASVTQVKRNSISISNSISNIYNNKEENLTKEERHKHGEYGWIKLTDEQYNRLKSEFANIDKVIDRIDEYVQSNGNKNKYKDWNLVIRKAIREKWSCLKDITDNQYSEEDLARYRRED